MKNNSLDQFYTNPKVCDYLIDLIHGMFNLKNYRIIEPAAGTGNFIDALYKIGYDIKNNNLLAYDIDPKSNSIIKKADFLTLNISNLVKQKDNTMIITNPPFGKRCDKAIDFINKSLKIADIVCMILPNTFNRYSVQSKIKSDAKLIYSISLDENSFIVNDREYSVKCCFQIWTNPNVKVWLSNKRLKKNNLNIDGLELFIHNNTKETLKYFDKKKYNWNFAIVRQGYYDYNKKIYNPKELKNNRQYLFIKTKNEYLLNLINEVNFSELAKKNTSVLGFSNSDLISELYKLHVQKILEF